MISQTDFLLNHGVITCDFGANFPVGTVVIAVGCGSKDNSFNSFSLCHIDYWHSVPLSFLYNIGIFRRYTVTHRRGYAWYHKVMTWPGWVTFHYRIELMYVHVKSHILLHTKYLKLSFLPVGQIFHNGIVHLYWSWTLVIYYSLFFCLNPQTYYYAFTWMGIQD